MKRLLPVFAVLFFLAGCKKNVSELPPPTGTGADTFGASVNGQLWTPQKFVIMPSAELLEAHYIPHGMIINARNFASSPSESVIKFEIKGVNGPGVYHLNGESGSYAYYVERKITPTGE